MKYYVVKSLSDPSAYQIERRTHPPLEHFGPPPMDNNGIFYTDASIFEVKDIWLDNSDPNNVVEKDAAIDDPGVEKIYKKTFISALLQTARNIEIIQEGRDVKLAKLRDLRKEKLGQVDLLINDLVVGDRSDTSVIQTYRTNLRNITNSYKDTDPMVGTSGLDAFAEDMSDFSGWPTEPS